MCEAGILGDSCRVEVIEGEMLQMAPEGTQRDIAKNQLLEDAMERAIATYGRDRPFKLLSAPTVWLADGGFIEPDIALIATVIKGKRFAAADLLLVIEISNASLGHDLNYKSSLYSSENIPEYWVLNLKSGTLVMHTEPTPKDYAAVTSQAAKGIVMAKTVPAFSIDIDQFL